MWYVFLSVAARKKVAAMEITVGQTPGLQRRGTCRRVCPLETAGGQQTVVSHLQAPSNTEASGYIYMYRSQEMTQTCEHMYTDCHTLWLHLMLLTHKYTPKHTRISLYNIIYNAINRC